jgi:hypothetical protein
MRCSSWRAAVIGILTLSVLIPIGATLDTVADGAGKNRARTVRATAFRSCDGLVDYARDRALNTVSSGRLVSPVALRDPVLSPAPVPLAAPAPAPRSVPLAEGAPVPASAPQTGAGAVPMSAPGDSDHSTTNVQEAGIDEPDIVKTDGSVIFAIAGERLHAVDTRGGKPRLVGSLSLDSVNGGEHELLLHGARLLVISRSFGSVGAATYRAGGSQTVLSEVDVRDPSAMRIVRRSTIDGDYVSSRQNGGTARIVIGSHARILDRLSPTPEPGPVPVLAARNQNLNSVAHSNVSSWIPHYSIRTRSSGRTARHWLVHCRKVRHAAAFSGLDLLTVLTVDLDKGLPAVDSDALMTDAQTVYASSRNLYVATQRWVPEADATGVTTTIHKFETTDRDSTTYRTSGNVPGFLLNQFSMSEYKGLLRVASTTGESFVTVLGERGNKLAAIGKVGGLGRGESIRSVRFIDDTGYVVTFRQTDPLYTIDLSKPERPTVLGELKILGYSAYLHPIGKDLLVGVGQDATEQGRTRGTQISLFDVSNLRQPVRLHSRTIARDSSSEAEADHHAFLYWPPSKLAVMPVQIYGSQSPGEQFNGAIGFRIDRDRGIEEAGRISHLSGAGGEQVRRALVVGGKLFTLSGRGIQAATLDTLTETAWVPFG